MGFRQTFMLISWVGMKSVTTAHKILLMTFTLTASRTSTLKAKVATASACLLFDRKEMLELNTQEEFDKLLDSSPNKRQRALYFKAKSPLICWITSLKSPCTRSFQISTRRAEKSPITKGSCSATLFEQRNSRHRWSMSWKDSDHGALLTGAYFLKVEHMTM